MTRRRLEAAWIGCLVVGVGVMVPFESTVPLALGVALLLAFITLGLFLVADPEWLAVDEDEADASPSAAATSRPPAPGSRKSDGPPSAGGTS